MPPRDTTPAVPAQLPADLAEQLDALGAPGLRAVAEYVERRRTNDQHVVSEQIRREAAGDIVSIDDTGAVTLVRMSPPAGTAAGDASQRVVLYRVRREPRPDGGETLHWSYLGAVVDTFPVRCENRDTVGHERGGTCPEYGDVPDPFDGED